MLTDLQNVPPVASLDDEWCSINEAARRLGVTPTAIRNRIKRGTLEVRPNGNFGRLVRVPRPVPGTVTLTPDEPVTDTVPGTVMDTVTDTLVDELRDRLAELQAHMAEIGGELRETRADLKQAQVTITELTAKAARVEGLESLLAAERERIADIRAERDRLLAQAERFAATPAPEARRGWWPFRKAG
jgi:hypothetical protein